MNPDKQHIIGEVMKSLDNAEGAKAPAFFYTRLKARMEKQLEAPGPVVRMLTKPILVIAVAAIVLLLNATAITEMWQQKNTVAAATAPVNETAQTFAAEYQLSTYSVYDENP